MRFLILLLVLPFAAAHAQPAGDAGAFADRMDDFLEYALDQLPVVPGLAVAVVRGDEIVYLRGVGMADPATGLPATPETAYYIASSTKSFTALAATLLDEQGRIDLGAPLSDYTPGVDYDPALRADAVMLRDLLTHTHGIENEPIGFRAAYTGEHTPEVMWQLLAASEPNAEAPLGTFEYTNVGYNILSLILDRETGRPWQTLLDELVFEPLGMERTTAYVSEMEREGWPVAIPHEPFGPDGEPAPVYLTKQDNTMQAAGGLYTTAADAARWLIAQLNEGRVDGEQVFPAEVIRRTHDSYAEVDARFGPFARVGYGLGWYVGDYEGERLMHHFGGFTGAHSHISFMPEHDLGVAVFVNEGSAGGRLAPLVATTTYDWWRGDADAFGRAEAMVQQGRAGLEQARERVLADRAKRAERTWQLSQPLDAYAGTYVSPSFGTMTVAVQDGAPVVRLGNMRAVATPFTEPETLRVELDPGRGTVIQFELGDGEKAERLFFRGVPFKRQR